VPSWPSGYGQIPPDVRWTIDGIWNYLNDLIYKGILEFEFIAVASALLAACFDSRSLVSSREISLAICCHMRSPAISPPFSTLAFSKNETNASAPPLNFRIATASARTSSCASSSDAIGSRRRISLVAMSDTGSAAR
jgi:hypothetical protein